MNPERRENTAEQLHEIPQRILSDLKRDDFVREQFAADAGVWEGYTIEEHTLMVMTQYEKYFSNDPLPGGMSPDSFRRILAVHDIGKPEAIAQGDKKNQHTHTLKYAPEILAREGLAPWEIDQAKALLSADPIGSYLQTGNTVEAKRSIKKMAKESGLPEGDFFKLLTVFYQVDAGAYTKDATIEGVVEGKESMDSLFVFDISNKKMAFTPEVEGKIDKLETVLFQADHIEAELPKEVFEKVMSKVQDIDARGTAFHVANRMVGEKTEEIFREGLLGQPIGGGRTFGATTLDRELKFGKDWAAHVTKKKEGFVHVNIVGRQTELKKKQFEWRDKTEIGRSYYMGFNPSTPEKIAIIFDISGYEERSSVQKSQSKTFKVNQSPGTLGYEEENGIPKPDSEYGFIVSYRIAPRLFQGVVLIAGRDKNEREIDMELFNNYRDDKRPEEELIKEIKKEKVEDKNPVHALKELVGTMHQVYKEKPEMMLPVYDTYGNLLWPKQMTYAEVKQFVAERDTKKNEGKE